jgi:hypothetical protein
MSDGCGSGRLRLIFELLDHALGYRDVAAFAEVNRLVDAAAFPVGVEITNIADLADFRNGVVGRDGDVAGGDLDAFIKERQGDAAFAVDGGDDEGRAFVEFELLLRTATSSG